MRYEICWILVGNPLLGRARRRWVYRLKFIIEKRDGMVWTDVIWLRLRITSGLL
jgi:hypothetical protein